MKLKKTQSIVKYNFAALDNDLMVMASVRYCLGRSSYIVSSCQTWIQTYWNNLPDKTKEIIIRDIVEYLIDTDALPPTRSVTPDWREFAQPLWDSLPPERKASIVSFVSHKLNKNFPLR